MAFPFFLIPLAAQGIQAAVQGGKAKKQNALSDKLDSQIPLNDPVQQSFLGKLQRQEKFYRAGTDASTSFANHNVRDAAAQAQSNLMRAGGSSATQNVLRSQGVANRGFAGNAAQAAGMADGMLGMQGNLINMMSQRRYDRQRYARDKALMQGQQYQQNSNNLVSSLYSTLGTMAGNMGGVGGGGAAGGAKSAAGGQMNQVPPMNTGQASFSQPMYENSTPGFGGNAYRDPYALPSAALDQNLSTYGQ